MYVSEGYVHYQQQPQPQFTIAQPNRPPSGPGMNVYGAPQPAPAPPQQRERKVIRIQDPNSGQDITEELVGGARSAKSATPPQSGPGSARATPNNAVSIRIFFLLSGRVELGYIEVGYVGERIILDKIFSHSTKQ